MARPAPKQLEARRTGVFLALRDGAETWTRPDGVGFTVSGVERRVLHAAPVVSVDLLATHNGKVVYDDRLNFPNPPLLVRNEDGTNTFAPLLAMRIVLEQEVERATDGLRTRRIMRDARGNLLGDTLVVFATEDGYLTSSNASITTARSGSNLTATVTTPNRVAAYLAASVYYFRTTYMAFDTSSLGAGATITASVLSLAGEGTAETNADSISMLAQYYDYGAGDPGTGDWINLTTSWSGLVDVGSFTVSGWNQTDNAYNAFSDSANYSSIAKTGVTRIVVGTSLHPSGTPTGVNQVLFHASEAAGTTGDPKLTITYTPGVQTVTPSAVAVTIQPVAPTMVKGAVVATPSPVAVTIQPVTPAVSQRYTAMPSPVAVTINIPAPTMVQGGTRTVTPDPVVVTIAPVAPAMQATLTITPDPVTVTIAAAAPTMRSVYTLTPDALVVTVQPVAPTLVPGAATLTPDPVVVTLAIPVISIGRTVIPAPVAVTIQVATPTVVSVYNATPDPVAVTLVIPTPVIIYTKFVYALGVAYDIATVRQSARDSAIIKKTAVDVATVSSGEGLDA